MEYYRLRANCYAEMPEYFDEAIADFQILIQTESCREDRIALSRVQLNAENFNSAIEGVNILVC